MNRKQTRLLQNLPDVLDLPEALAHDVNVVDVEKNEFDIFVQVLVLVTTAGRYVSHCVHFWPGIHDEDAMRLSVCVHYLKKKL